MPSIVATLKVKEDKIEEAKTFMKALAAEVSANEPGTLAYIAHQSQSDPATFIFYEKYQDQDALKTHGANLAAKNAEFAALLAGRPDIQMIEEI